MDSKKERIKKIARVAYMIVPLVSATISAFHVESLLRLGNPTFLSVSTAVAYEIANIGAMIIFVLIPRVKMNMIWAAFIILVFMQIIGNIYFAYDYIQDGIKANPDYVGNFVKMVRSLTDFMEVETIIFVLACLIGAPVPIVALLLTKGTSEYLSDEKEKEFAHTENSTINEENIEVAEISPNTKDDIVVENPTITENKEEKNDDGHGIIVNY